MTVTLRPQFITGRGGDLFLLQCMPAVREPASQWVLFVPPFGEELNKSRRMFHLQAMSLAQNGIASAIIDLYGTGDSAGEFADATWEQWLADLATARDFLSSGGAAEVVYVALRMGALLALEHVTRTSRTGKLILWHPWVDGRAELDNLLRMRVVADKFLHGASKTSVAVLRADFEAGRSVEIGGYEVTSRLAAEIDSRHMSALVEDTPLEIAWLDVGTEEGADLPPARRTLLEALPGRTIADVRVVGGDRFWSTADIATCPSLIDATTALLCTR